MNRAFIVDITFVAVSDMQSVHLIFKTGPAIKVYLSSSYQDSADTIDC